MGANDLWYWRALKPFIQSDSRIMFLIIKQNILHILHRSNFIMGYLNAICIVYVWIQNFNFTIVNFNILTSRPQFLILMQNIIRESLCILWSVLRYVILELVRSPLLCGISDSHNLIKVCLWYDSGVATNFSTHDQKYVNYEQFMKNMYSAIY